MGAIAQSLPGASGRFESLWRYLKSELTPYRGRAALVARMVTATTLMMIVCMTFKIPYAAYAALFALNISRESIAGTLKDAQALVVGSGVGGAYVIVSIALVAGNEILRFLWAGTTLFVAFYAISALGNYAASARFAYLIVIVIPLLDSKASAGSKVESTLWAVGAIALGSVTTLLMEVVFSAFRRTDTLTEALTERLLGVEGILTHYVDYRPVDDAARSEIGRLAIVGTSRLRVRLQRASYEPQRKQLIAAIVALVGRMVDIVANFAEFNSRVGQNERHRIWRVVQNIAEIRTAIESRRVPHSSDSTGGSETPPSLPLLGELEKIVSQIYEVLTGARSMTDYLPATSEDQVRIKPFVFGALSNPEHLKFALRGCLAAGLCYITYNALFWPGIATSVVTCLLTALTTIGASHQKQFLRFTGALFGGVVIGMGAQVFILPNIDSIAAFTVLFAIVAGIAAWFATASTRLSYFGIQIATAFYLMNLQEFKIQTSLAVARDRIVGILLGLAMMWLAYDLLWSAPAAVEMKKAFVSTIRSLAQLAREPVSEDRRAATTHASALRDSINAQFDKVRSLADGVLFEFGPSRQQDLALRDRIRKWQPQLRTLFLMRLASLKYRFQVPGFELPDEVQHAQKEYDDRSAQMLEDMADRIEGSSGKRDHVPEDSLLRLDQSTWIRTLEESHQSPAINLPSFGALIRKIDSLTRELATEVAADDRRAA